MKSAGKARSNGLYRHIRTSKEIIRNLLNDYCEIIHPTTFYCSFLCLDMLTQYLLLAKIIHIIAG